MLRQIVKEIKKAQNIALFHHINPDGDSISSSYGLLLAIKQKYPSKNVVFVADREQILTKFPNWGIRPETMQLEIDSSYLVIIGDAAVYGRIEHYEQYQKGYKKIVFDHHKYPEVPDFEHDIYWREEKFVASAMQAYLIADALSIRQMSEETAFALMIGLVTDSGNFVYSYNDPQVVLMYADLLERISKTKMQNFYNDMRKRSKANFELLKLILNQVQYSSHVSYVILNKAFIEKYTKQAVAQLTNSIGNIEGYPIWALFMERLEVTPEGDKWDVHLRSNGPKVVEVANEYGGGGHEKSAGCRIKTKQEIKVVLSKLDKLNIL